MDNNTKITSIRLDQRSDRLRQNYVEISWFLRVNKTTFCLRKKIQYLKSWYLVKQCMLLIYFRFIQDTRCKWFSWGNYLGLCLLFLIDLDVSYSPSFCKIRPWRPRMFGLCPHLLPSGCRELRVCAGLCGTLRVSGACGCQRAAGAALIPGGGRFDRQP